MSLGCTTLRFRTKASGVQPGSRMLAELARARRVTDDLFALVRDEALTERPIPERHRLVFYVGHLEAFDWNLLGRDGPVNQRLDKLFAFGIDPPPGQAPRDTPGDWPELDCVRRYVEATRQAVDEVAARTPDALMRVAVEHRLMHAETLCYLLHQLDYAYKRPPESPERITSGRSAAADWVLVPEGEATLGKPRGDGVGWDNEFDAHRVAVPAFEAGRFLVTQGEYVRYVEAGGAPSHFWVRRGPEWRYRGMFDEFPLPIDWPVYVTHRQAEAYAQWAGARLPAEAEYHRYASDEPGNAGGVRWEPIAVDAFPGFAPGNAWEWTATPFAPFPGFEPFPFYRNYSEPFFDGDHYVMKGASPRTDRLLIRPSFRNWFRPEYPYAYAGFRLAKDRR